MIKLTVTPNSNVLLNGIIPMTVSDVKGCTTTPITNGVSLNTPGRYIINGSISFQTTNAVTETIQMNINDVPSKNDSFTATSTAGGIVAIPICTEVLVGNSCICVNNDKAITFTSSQDGVAIGGNVVVTKL